MQLRPHESSPAGIGYATYFPYNAELAERREMQIGEKTYVHLYRYTPIQIRKPLQEGDDEEGDP